MCVFNKLSIYLHVYKSNSYLCQREGLEGSHNLNFLLTTQSMTSRAGPRPAQPRKMRDITSPGASPPRASREVSTETQVCSGLFGVVSAAVENQTMVDLIFHSSYKVVRPRVVRIWGYGGGYGGARLSNQDRGMLTGYPGAGRRRSLRLHPVVYPERRLWPQHLPRKAF